MLGAKLVWLLIRFENHYQILGSEHSVSICCCKAWGSIPFSVTSHFLAWQYSSLYITSHTSLSM